MERLLKGIIKFIKTILILVSICILLLIAYITMNDGNDISFDNINNKNKTSYSGITLNVLSSSENKDFEPYLTEFAESCDINLNFEYAGNLDIIEKLNTSSSDYDIVWNSNSIWNYMLEDTSVLTDSISVSTNPVVFAVKKSKAQELGLIKDEIYLRDIVNEITAGNLKFSMANPTQTNSGASTYLGMLSVFAGNPEVLKSEHINDDNIKNLFVDFFMKLDRSSGSEDFLKEIILKDEYNAVATYESSIINMNKVLEKENKETFYILYPVDGVSISDSPFAYIDNDNINKKEAYTEIKNYMLSSEAKDVLESLGRRTWYGGISSDVDKTVFYEGWGIDTEEYIVPIKYPHVDIIKEALNLYQNEFRKPMCIVFCLDYSGSMYGQNQADLIEAMEYVLIKENAEQNYIQFSEKDRIIVIPFNNDVINVWGTYEGNKTEELVTKIRELKPSGSTNIYDPVAMGLEFLNGYDSNEYSKSVILMTDGESNRGSFISLSDYYRQRGSNVPVYSIKFGEASESELEKINQLTNGKTFDGKDNLLKAFKEVRAYN